MFLKKNVDEDEIFTEPKEINRKPTSSYALKTVIRLPAVKSCENSLPDEEMVIATISGSLASPPSPQPPLPLMCLNYPSVFSPSPLSPGLDQLAPDFESTHLVNKTRHRAVWPLTCDSLYKSMLSLAPVSPTTARRLSIGESLDSGLVTLSASSSTLSCPIVEPQFQMQVPETSCCCCSRRRRGVFEYLFDLSHLVQDTLLDHWPADYVRKLKRSLTEFISNKQALAWRGHSGDDDNHDRVPLLLFSSHDDTQSLRAFSFFTKPLSILRLLTSFSLFRLLFRATSSVSPPPLSTTAQSHSTWLWL